MKHFTFKLPVKKYIAKYLTTLYGETIPVKMETDIGFVILNTLASRMESQVTRGRVDLLLNRYDSTITFVIPFHYFYLTKKEVSPMTCMLLNRYFETKFENDLCSYVNAARLMGTKRKKAIEKFTAIYSIDIDIDISSDALRQSEYRHRKKNFDKFLCRLSHHAQGLQKAV